MMQTLAVNWGNLGMGLFIVWFLLVCVLLILAVLIQKPQGGGLAGAFGSGAGSGQTAFGAKTGDALTWATIIMFVVWLITAVGLNLAFQPSDLSEPAAISAPEGTETGTPPPESGTPATEGGDAPQNQPIPIQPVPVQPPAPEGGAPAPSAEPASQPAPTEPAPTEPPAAPPPAEPAPGR